MKKQVIIDLITAHYEDDPRLFFRRTIDVLKEFKEDGDDALIQHLDFILKSKVKIAPKREVRKLEDLNEEISFDDAVDLGWIPMSEDEVEKYSICPKCGSKNIIGNRDFSDPWIKCLDCGHYLREGKKP